jgi:hypothetical protein
MKRIMRRFVIGEVSAVDKPAQTGAKAVILKRDGGADMEHLPRLLESIRTILEDDELEDDEREAMLRGTFSEYKSFTGRDGLSDIATTHGEYSKRDEETPAMNVDVGALAMFALECAANKLRKANPSLSAEQAFAKAFSDPANREATRAEREASRRRIAGVGLAQTEPEILPTLSDADIKRLIARERARFPFLDGKQLLEVVENSPEMREHRAAVRQAEAAARRDGATLPPPQTVSIMKRDDALGALQAKANQLRESDPSLTPEGAFSKAYRLHPDLARAEREASRAALFAA